MDATKKERLMHAAEVLQWMADEKDIQRNDCGIWRDIVITEEFMFELFAKFAMSGVKYRIKPAKTRRPFTAAQIGGLIGYVLVPPTCFAKYTVMSAENDIAIIVRNRIGYGLLATTLCDEGWHYHLPGDPDNLKPCWVEE